ncbi:hemolysin D [Kordiimonas sediminis]|uniref:Hemolysin D n=1 Tax=Kordiimonas sediminis TaxID=1735581 RepID=A0A919AQ39_9PROT|nr:efflux RND transporter periplasmic adaptor subunit [Kordiimonas sediminis]GHF19360.1 hemolysin D [Kordiimonas sediminis]
MTVSTVKLVGVGLFLGLGIGIAGTMMTGTYLSGAADHGAAPAGKSSNDGEPEIDYWVAPMDPNYRRDKPGKSPMGMDLIPVYKGEGPDAADAGFTVSPNVVASLGVKTTPVVQQHFAPKLRVTGQVAYDERQVSQVQVREEGWVEKLYVRFAGDQVEKGAPLFSYYAPGIANAIADYMHIMKTGSEAFKSAARVRLRALGLSDRSLQAVLDAGDPHTPITVYAPQGGIVTALGVREGSRFAAATVAFEITDTETMWIVADVFAGQGAELSVGDTVTLASGETATIDYIYSDVEKTLQTTRVRVTAQNSDGHLKAGAFTTLEFTPAGQHALVVPDTAIIRLGDSDRVIISHGDGKFEAAEVTTGASDGTNTAIASGLAEGEEVVISGQFMLDSESSFTGAALRMAETSTGGKDEQEIETAAFAMGTIHSADIDSRTVSITHPEIPEIGWNPMTMDMEVAKGVPLEDMTFPASVHFGVGQDATGKYVITVIHVMDSAMGDMS